MSLMLILWNNPQLAYLNFYFFVNGEETPDSLYIRLMVIDVQNLSYNMYKINESYLYSVHFIKTAATECKQEAAKICKGKKKSKLLVMVITVRVMCFIAKMTDWRVYI